MSGSPLNAVLSSGMSDANLGLFGGRQRPNLTGDPNTSGSDDDRVASAEHPDARWFNAAAFANPGVGPVRQRARARIGDARYQFRKNIDLVLAKDTAVSGGSIGEIRFEILNLTNTAKFGNESTEQLDRLVELRPHHVQAGFMRIWQLTFRYRF